MARLGQVSVSVGGQEGFDVHLAASRVHLAAMTALDDIEFRTARGDDPIEYRSYMRIYWDIQVGIDPGFTRRSDAFLDSWIEDVRDRETERNTHNGIALHEGEIVGLYTVRAHDVYGRLGAHVAGLWVHEDYRRMGVAATLREQAEAWARGIGAEFLSANVHVDNERMLELSEEAGFEVFQLHIRKDLR